MRLLHCKTLTLESFFADSIPPYAILSHRWEDEEVSFQAIQTAEAKSLKGYKKIEGFCKVARTDGYEYVWIDTCCIDKSSSSELQEAINSMWDWYRTADVCFVYLSDVHDMEVYDGLQSTFSRSKWFTRGWTLQELIAPPSLIFYTTDWRELGTKSSLKEVLEKITGIPQEVLIDGILDHVNIANKMSWASRRHTTRIEDQAYCLMGIFKINMPMLYGEGGQAFIRLQEEIMKRSHDYTIFAWTTNVTEHELTRVERGFLALSPSDFKNGHSISDQSFGRFSTLPSTIQPFSTTNRGIQLELPVKQLKPGGPGSHIAILDSCYSGDNLVAIKISKWGREDTHSDLDTRSRNSELLLIRPDEAKSFIITRIFAKRDNALPLQRPHVSSQALFRISVRLLPNVEGNGYSVYGWWPQNNLSSDGDLYVFEDTTPGDIIGIQFRRDNAGQLSEFIIALVWIHGAISADITDVDPKLSLPQVCSMAGKRMELQRTRAPQSDRISSPIGGGNEVQLAIRNQVIDKERTQVVFISIVKA